MALRVVMQLLVTFLLLLQCKSFAFIATRSRSSGIICCSQKKDVLHELSLSRNDINSNDDSSITVASQAALIAGTTIGGGFLALPAATAPCGMAPAVVGLVFVWFFLLGGALSLSDAIFLLKNQETQEEKDPFESRSISLFSIVQECFGTVPGLFAGLVFLLLIEVTLVAQLSKVGVLLTNTFSILSRQIWTFIYSITLASYCMLGTKRNIECVNSVLTATMLTSFSLLVFLAGGSGWSSVGLHRADYSLLLPSRLAANEAPWAIPVFIQLLIYNEVVPLVASRLNDVVKVRKAIVYGSLVPLAMCLIWSCVVLGLVPYDLTSVASGVIYDPLTKLSGTPLLKYGLTGKAFLASVNILAGSAICTTVIGSILASTQYFDDLLTNLMGLRKSNIEIGRRRTTTTLKKVTAHILAIAPSLIIALIGSSKIYYDATSFAGKFPCTFLYGLVPPLCNLRLRSLYNMKRKVKMSSNSYVVQVALAMISSIILFSCTHFD